MSTEPLALQPPGPGWKIVCDNGLAFRAITGDFAPANGLLRSIAERIRVAAGHLGLGPQDLHRIFSRHDIFEGEMNVTLNGRSADFILVETYHQIHGMVGKGALKLVFPQDLLGEGGQFREAGPGVVEVLPPAGAGAWASPAEAEAVVKGAMREFMTGETLSMSLKSQATGAPFAGSEGLVLCALREFDAARGRYYLKPAIQPGEEKTRADKDLIEHMMNQAAELLTRAGRIAFDQIVHAAETNSTLTAKLDLQLPANVVEGHLRCLLRQDPNIVIGDEDMTARLREIWRSEDYEAVACPLASAAARMQIEHSILLPASRDRLRRLLGDLAGRSVPTPDQYRELIDLFFGGGETQQIEDQLYHRREPILRTLSVALSARSLDECGEPAVLEFYLRTLLDNQRISLEAALLRRLPPGQPLPMDWFDRAPLLSRDQERRLAALLPGPAITRDKVREHFWEVVTILCEAKAGLPRYTPDPHLQARKDVLERATRAITAAGDLLPSCDRIIFFTLPYAYECVTPKLGVVTRKPVALCGSELRPEAMAAGGVMSVEIFLKRLTGKPRPLQGLTVAIEGLGNAGKHVATSMLQKGATIIGVSDSRGAVVSPDGLTREELAVIIAHKNSGRRLDTLLSSPAARGLSARDGAPVTFWPEPQKLHQIKADILVLAAIPGTIRADRAQELQVRLVCELTGAAVTGEAKRVLKQRRIHVIPDNLASSGGLLVSLSEMLQNSAGQNWDRKLEEHNLYQQLSRSCDAVLDVARRHDVDAPTASDLLALGRMHELALYREQVERAAAELARRLRAIQPAERVLIVSDDDEDGVASAAMLHTMLAQLNPGAEARAAFLNESFRSRVMLDRVLAAEGTPQPVRHVFVLDRAFPASEPAQARLRELLERCQVTIVNNHPLPPELARQPELLSLQGTLFISPQSLRSPRSGKHYSTAMILRELACQLLTDPQALARIHWQTAVASCLDVPEEADSEWVWFFAQFNPDRAMEAARALRLVTRAGGFLNAVHALLGVTRPDQLETHPAWQQFMAEFRLLEERVQVLVEKIILENRGRPCISHFFTPDEVASPTPVAGDAAEELDFYHWISEHLTRRGNLAEKPIIVGQVVRDAGGQPCLGVRIRSPRGVDLGEVGLPREFSSGGLPNTALGKFPLPPGAPPEREFQRVVDAIWLKTTHPLYLASSPLAGE